MASRITRFMQDNPGCRVDDLAAAVSKAFDVTPDRARSDVSGLLVGLEEEGIIDIR